MRAVVELIDGCECAHGCPSCIGALVERDVDARKAAIRIARGLPGRLPVTPVPAGAEQSALAATREA
jgi:ATP-dependent helicase YprA (DUF1998 family)